MKGRTAIRVFNRFRKLQQKPYWGNHFWAKGYCVDTVGLDADKIARYVKYQEAKERQTESKQQRLFKIKPGITPRPLWGQEAFLSPFKGKLNTTPSGCGFFISIKLQIMFFKEFIQPGL